MASFDTFYNPTGVDTLGHINANTLSPWPFFGMADELADEIGKRDSFPDLLLAILQPCGAMLLEGTVDAEGVYQSALITKDDEYDESDPPLPPLVAYVNINIDVIIYVYDYDIVAVVQDKPQEESIVRIFRMP